MNLLTRIRLTLHSAVEVIHQCGLTDRPSSSDLPDTVILATRSDSVVRRIREAHAE